MLAFFGLFPALGQRSPSEKMINIHTIYGVFQRYFRPRRIKALKAQFPLLEDPTITILDVGGVAAWWTDVKPASRAITVVNMDGLHESTCTAAGIKFMVADGRNLPFADKQFDFVLSNSVIEHVGGLEDQRRFAAEMVRCGKSIYMQTPNRWFPVEPHLIALFIHWFPFSVLRHLVRWFSVWGLVHRPTQKQVDDFLRDTRLLTRQEVVSIFPDCKFEDEKVLGLSKSFIAVLRPS